MHRHRNPRPKVSKRPSPDNRRTTPPVPAPEPESDEFNHLIHTLRDNLRRADAFVSTAEHQIEENWHDNDGGDESDEEDRKEEDRKMRHRMRIEYLVEAGRCAVRRALDTTQQIEAALARRRSA
jgi:hypothetical protein